MKRIVLCLVLAVPAFKAYGADPHYEFNNSNQQLAIEKAVYEEVIQQTLNTKCTAIVDTNIPDAFLLNNNRHVDVSVSIYKEKKKVADIKQRVTYNSYSKFKYSLYQIVSFQCR